MKFIPLSPSFADAPTRPGAPFRTRNAPTMNMTEANMSPNHFFVPSPTLAVPVAALGYLRHSTPAGVLSVRSMAEKADDSCCPPTRGQPRGEPHRLDVPGVRCDALLAADRSGLFGSVWHGGGALDS